MCRPGLGTLIDIRQTFERRPALLRQMGSGKALSVAGGFQAWKKLRQAA